MDIFITSLDNPQKKLRVSSGSGLHATDIYLNAANTDAKKYEDYFFSQSVHLTSTLGNNWGHVCPLYAAIQKTWNLFKNNKEDMINNSCRPEADYSFSAENVISFGVPDYYGSPQQLDFILSDRGAFGIRTGSLFKQQEFLSGTEIIWVCDTKKDKRRNIFGGLYQLASANPIQMANPIFPGESGLKCITRGNQNAYHQ